MPKSQSRPVSISPVTPAGPAISPPYPIPAPAQRLIDAHTRRSVAHTTSTAPASPAPTPASRPFPSRMVADSLKLAGDATRINILIEVAKAERSVMELCEIVGATQPNLSRHLALLRTSRIVQSERRGTSVIYSPTERGKTLLRAILGLAD